MTLPELTVCPICGNDSVYWEDYDDMYFVMCSECELCIGGVCTTCGGKGHKFTPDGEYILPCINCERGINWFGTNEGDK